MKVLTASTAAIVAAPLTVSALPVEINATGQINSFQFPDGRNVVASDDLINITPNPAPQYTFNATFNGASDPEVTVLSDRIKRVSDFSDVAWTLTYDALDGSGSIKTLSGNKGALEKAELNPERAPGPASFNQYALSFFYSELPDNFGDRLHIILSENDLALDFDGPDTTSTVLNLEEAYNAGVIGFPNTIGNGFSFYAEAFVHENLDPNTNVIFNEASLDTFSAKVVPAPSSAVSLALGGAGLAMRRRAGGAVAQDNNHVVTLDI